MLEILDLPQCHSQQRNHHGDPENFETMQSSQRCNFCFQRHALLCKLPKLDSSYNSWYWVEPNVVSVKQLPPRPLSNVENLQPVTLDMPCFMTTCWGNTNKREQKYTQLQKCLKEIDQKHDTSKLFFGLIKMMWHSSRMIVGQKSLLLFKTLFKVINKPKPAIAQEVFLSIPLHWHEPPPAVAPSIGLCWHKPGKSQQ